MAPIALQMSLVGSKSATKIVQNTSSAFRSQRFALQQRSPHVMRATKVTDLDSTVKPEKKHKKEDDDEDFEGDDGLSPQQVETFLNVLCEETDIAEVELKMGGFKMKVRRSLKGGAAAAVAPVAAAAPAPVVAPAPVAAAPAFEEEAAYESDSDESIIAITAPKVGTLRRGRYMKGKQVGKGNIVEAGDTVKKGQVIGYIEQLGTHWPIECPQAGEITAFLVDEGEAVEYLQPVVEISPFFGGHIIGDSKYA